MAVLLPAAFLRRRSEQFPSRRIGTPGLRSFFYTCRGPWSRGMSVSDSAAGTNVAFRKPTNQSTTVRGGDASHGNDGDSSTEHDGKRCTETQSEPSPWWKVDLLKSYSVKVVRVTTRGCCGKFADHTCAVYRCKRRMD